MSAAIPSDSENKLINCLPARQRSQFVGNCRATKLDIGTILYEPYQFFRYVYFPLGGFISIVEIKDGHDPLELGLVGNEGMLGVTQALGMDYATQRAVVQSAGTALCMSTQEFRYTLLKSAASRRILNRYLHASIAELSKSTACSHFYEIEGRLAR